MASQFQMLIYEGFLGADPEKRFTPDGKEVTNFRIGSTQTWTARDGQKVSETTWLKVACFGNNLPEIVNKYCTKGTHVMITGRLRPGDGGNPKVFPTRDGGYGASYEVTASSIRIFNTKNAVVADTAEDVVDESEVEIPF